MTDYIRFHQKVAFVKPIDGDILNRYDGKEKNGVFRSVSIDQNRFSGFSFHKKTDR